MYRKSQKNFNNRQLYALKELHKWRDKTARAEDESTNYILPNHMLLNISEVLPREMQGVLACCNPIPPVVRQNLLEIHKMILKAREQPIIKPVLEEDMRQRLAQRNQDTNSESWILETHDIPSGTEPRADLPCLLNSPSTELMVINQMKPKPLITIFESYPLNDSEAQSKNQGKINFISPYERYRRTMPVVNEEEKKQRDKEDKIERERTELLKEKQRIQEEKEESVESIRQYYLKHSQNKSKTPETSNASTQKKSKESEKQNESKEVDTSNSEHISRIHEHFLKEAQKANTSGKQTSSNETSHSNKNKQSKQSRTLNQIPGRKRKKELDPGITRPFNKNSQRGQNLTDVSKNKKKRK